MKKERKGRDGRSENRVVVVAFLVMSVVTSAAAQTVPFQTANFGVLGTGSDTGQSIRSPASALSLVGLRPTRGLVSRDGIIPYSSTQDEAGPIARTVEDAARMLDAIAGYDPADPITAFGTTRIPRSYTESLTKDGLAGARIGVLTEFFGHEPIHHEVNAVVESAIGRMTPIGAVIVRVSLRDIDELTRGLSLTTFEFKPAFNRYLASLGSGAPVKSLDAVLYPHQRRLVVPIGEEQVDRNGVLSNSTGFPAITFPGGFSAPTASAPRGVPIGIELLGPEWSEPMLLKLAYAFQEQVRVRKTPVLSSGVSPLNQDRTRHPR